MNLCVLDTETTSTNKPFCYNIGYVIGDDSGVISQEQDSVVEQIWHNNSLFATAYYADKRPKYVDAMRARKAKMDKWGYIMRDLNNAMRANKVDYAYAYNCAFDDRVVAFNCDWFKTLNPLDTVPILDIRAFAIKAFVDEDYKKFCEDNGYFTEYGNYSTTAETMYRYLFDENFEEAHTALADSRIEYEILLAAKDAGVDITDATIKCPRSIEREQHRKLTVKKNGVVLLNEDYDKIAISKDKQIITLK